MVHSLVGMTACWKENAMVYGVETVYGKDALTAHSAVVVMANSKAAVKAHLMAPWTAHSMGLMTARS
jgi:hypothetical protein